MDFDDADALNEAIRAIGIRHRALSIDALAPFGIHPGHKLLLFDLEREGPRTQAQLAAACGYEPPTITLSVRQLETAGLVVRRSSPTDGRATIVELSDEGRLLLPKLREAWTTVAAQTVAGLASTTVDQLTTVLEDLASSLDAGAAPAADVPRYVRRSRAHPMPTEDAGSAG
jgi:DNA-binding MarR family transcriptional regulator